MRRADRLFQIVQLIRGRRLTTAAFLAQRLEVSERTIYRDVADLQVQGVPIEGEAGVGYRLGTGFDLPPLMFTQDEATALVAAARLAQSWVDPAMARDIQTAALNYTRFFEIALEADACPPDVRCKTSLLLATGHRPGDLGEVLRHFSDRGVNLTKLESRPIPGRPWQYRFYLDVEGHAASEPVVEALQAAATHTAELRIIGTYPAATRTTFGAPITPTAGEESSPAMPAAGGKATR